MIKIMQVFRGDKRHAAILLLALALLVSVIALAAGGGSSTANRNRQLAIPQEPNGPARTFALLTGIPQQGAVLGDPKAPVTLQFFGDLQCVDSRRVMLGALPFLIRRFVRAGKLRIRFRSTETDTRNPGGGWYEFREQQTAAMAAGRQDKLWNFIDVFYREQGPEGADYVDNAYLDRIAKDAGVNVQRWEQDRVPLREEGIDLIQADEELAAVKHLVTTPSFLIGRTGGSARKLRHFAFEEPQAFEEAIDGLL